MIFNKEEHELKMLHMQEQHDKDLQIKDEQHALTMELLKHKINFET